MKKKGARGGGRKEGRKPTPSFLFWLSPQFRPGKIPFLGLSLLPNPTETLATQDTIDGVTVVVAVMITSVERFDLVEIKPTEWEADIRSADDSVVYYQVKTALSESQAEAEE